MWCKGCRQDVPALPSGDSQTLCCPRCGTALCADPNKSAAVDQLPGYDSWELDEQLQHIQRILQIGKATDRDSDAAARREVARFDPPQAGLSGQHVASNQVGKPALPNKRRSGAGGLTWFVLSIGTAGFMCGGILLAWSLATGRQELWNVGLPVALVGQICLLVGLVLQIDRLWSDNREAAAKLDNVDEQIHELKATTMLLNASQGAAATTFYSHLAGGAGPQLLLTDLKSQLDLLAMKIAQAE
jgi:hypothetical protein